MTAIEAGGAAMELEQRIEAALTRIDNGHAPRRIPADQTDVNLVLADCRTALADLRAQRDAAQGERDELRKLLTPEVQAACELLQRNADQHPDACCVKCGEGLTERDQLRANLATRTAEVAEARGKLTEHEQINREMCDMGMQQAQEWDRFWAAMGACDERVTVEDAIAKWRQLEADLTRSRAEAVGLRALLEALTAAAIEVVEREAEGGNDWRQSKLIGHVSEWEDLAALLVERIEPALATPPDTRLAALRGLRKALRDLVTHAGRVVQEARHHAMHPAVQRLLDGKLGDLERATAPDSPAVVALAATDFLRVDDGGGGQEEGSA